MSATWPSDFRPRRRQGGGVGRHVAPTGKRRGGGRVSLCSRPAAPLVVALTRPRVPSRPPEASLRATGTGPTGETKRQTQRRGLPADPVKAVERSRRRQADSSSLSSAAPVELKVYRCGSARCCLCLRKRTSPAPGRGAHISRCSVRIGKETDKAKQVSPFRCIF